MTKRPVNLLGWVVFANGEAHLLTDEGDGPVYPCGSVFYTPVVNTPRVTGMDVVFCSWCRRIQERVIDTSYKGDQA